MSHDERGATMASRDERSERRDVKHLRVGTAEDLLSRAHHYNFFVTVGMLERLTPESVRVGSEGPYGDEAIRFRHDHELVFSAGEITQLERVKIPQSPEQALEQPRYRYEVTTSFLGISGSISPLPLFMAEEVSQDDEGARIKREFLDVFHHRLISLIYRIGIKFDFPREYTSGASDLWSCRMLAAAGLDAYETWRLASVPRWKMLRLAPLLASRVRSARMLEQALEDVVSEALLGAKVRIKQFSGEWTPLDVEQRMELGVRNANLGVDGVLGVQCFHRGSKATVVIGPLRENFRRFLTDGDMYPVICEALGVMSPEPIEYELDLVLAEQARPPFFLGHKEGGRIGFDSWLSSRAGSRRQTHLKVPLPNDLLKQAKPRQLG